MVAGLQPGHTAQPGNVQQHAAPDDAVVDEVQGQFAGALRRQACRRDTAVQLAVEDHVTERVEVAVRVPVHVHRQPVTGEVQPRRVDVVRRGAGHRVVRGFCVVTPRTGLDGGGERHRAPGADLGHGGHDAFGRQMAQGPGPRGAAAPYAVTQFLVQRPERLTCHALGGGPPGRGHDDSPTPAADPTRRLRDRVRGVVISSERLRTPSGRRCRPAASACMRRSSLWSRRAGSRSPVRGHGGSPPRGLRRRLRPCLSS